MSVFEELFSKDFPFEIAPSECITRAICALVDEVRAQRLQALQFEQAEVAAREQEAAARVERYEMMKSQMEGFRESIADLPPSQTTILVPDHPRQPLPVVIPRCECNHGIAAHPRGGPCELCECKGFTILQEATT